MYVEFHPSDHTFCRIIAGLSRDELGQHFELSTRNVCWGIGLLMYKTAASISEAMIAFWILNNFLVTSL
jgi:hypothetical protein